MIYLFQYKQLLKQVLKKYPNFLLKLWWQQPKKSNLKIMPRVHKLHSYKLSNNLWASKEGVTRWKIWRLVRQYLTQSQESLDKLQFVDVVLDLVGPGGLLHQHGLGWERGAGHDLPGKRIKTSNSDWKILTLIPLQLIPNISDRRLSRLKIWVSCWESLK